MPSLLIADTVRLSDGNSCSFSSNDHPWEFAVSGKKHDVEEQPGSFLYRQRARDLDRYEMGLSLKYKFGGPRRLDCSKLYNIQLSSKEAELKMLREKLKILESSPYIKWD